MDLFELSATLGLDTKPFKSSLKDVARMVVDFGKDVIQTGMDASKAESAALAVMRGITAQSEEWLALEDHVLQSARDSIFTVEESWNAVEELGRMGFDVEQSMDSLVGVLDLAAVEEMGLAKAAKIVASTLRAFNMEADQSGYLVDILAQTSRSSGTNVAELGKALEYAGSQLGAMGVGVDDAALAIGLMGDRMVNSGKAGRALRNIVQRLATDTGNARSLMEEYGIAVFDADGRMRNFEQILREARIAWAGMTEQEKVANAAIVAGTTGATGWLNIMNATEKQFEDLDTAIENANDSAHEMAEIRLDNFGGQIEKLLSRYDVLKNYLFKNVESPLQLVASDVSDAIDRITNAVQSDGLLGGIRQLATEIQDFSESYKDEFKALGDALIPILTTLVDTVAPAFIVLAMKLGGSFAAGIIAGIGKHLAEKKDSILDTLTFGLYDDIRGFFGGGEVTEDVIQIDPIRSIQDLFGWNDGDNSTPTIPLKPVLDTEELTSDLEEIKTEYETENKINQYVIPMIDPDAPNLSDEINDGIVDGATEGINTATSTVFLPSSDELYSMYFGSMSDAGTDGGRDMGTNAAMQLAYAEQGMRDGLVDVISDAGDPIGRNIANDIYNHLISTPFRINVSANVSNMPIARRNDFSNVQSSIGLKNNFGSNFISDMVNNAINKNMGGQEIVVPRQAAGGEGGGKNGAVMMVDRTIFARLIYTLYNEEATRVGINVAGGAY